MRGHVSSTAIRNSAMMLVSRRGAARGGTDIGGARSHTSGLHGCAGTCGCTLRERGILNRKDNWRSGYIMSATILRQETLL